jgi:hypothetical protein
VRAWATPDGRIRLARDALRGVVYGAGLLLLIHWLGASGLVALPALILLVWAVEIAALGVRDRLSRRS